MHRVATFVAGLVGLALVLGACAPSGEAPEASAAPDRARITLVDVGGEEAAEPNPGSLLGQETDGDDRWPTSAESDWVIVAQATVDQVVARDRPSEAAPRVADLANPTDVGGPLVFQLVETEIDELDGWVEVHLPIRPNGSTGWVRVAEVELTRNPYRIEIDAARHRLRVLEQGDEWLSATVAIGTGATPTPRGRFYITELLQPPDPDGIYGPFAFGLSGFSETLTSFAGGDGVIGIHGTNQPQALGTDVSHGCVRLDNSVITTLAAVIPLGTPVEIVG